MIESKEIVEALKQMNKVAIMEINNGNYSNALDIFTKAKEYEEKLNLKAHVAESFINIANTYYLMGHYDSSLENLNSALDIFKRERNPAGIFKASQLIGTVYYQKEDFIKASQYFDTCIRMNIGHKENAVSYYQGGLAYIKQKNNLRAQDYLGRALNWFEMLNDPQGITDCLRQRAELFRSMGREDLAARDLARCPK